MMNNEDSDKLLRYAELVIFPPSSEPPKPGNIVARRDRFDIPIGVLAEIHGEWATLMVRRIDNPITLDMNDE